MAAVHHQPPGDEVPSLDQARTPRFPNIESKFSSVVNFLIAMSQEASGSGSGATCAFWPAGTIRQLLEACTNLGTDANNAAAMELAEKTFRALGNSTGVIGPGPGQRNLVVEQALREAVDLLSAAARAGRPAMDTVDAVVELLLPHVPKGIDLLTGRTIPS